MRFYFHPFQRTICLVILVLNGIISRLCAQEIPQLILPVGHTGAILSVDFSPDGRYILSGSADKTLKLWEIATGREIKTFAGHASPVVSVAMGGNGGYALSASNDNTVYLWNITSGEKEEIWGDHRGDVRAVTFHPAAQLAAICSGDTLIILSEIFSEPVKRIFWGHSNLLTAVAVSPDGKLLLSGTTDKTIKLWNVTTGECLRTFTDHSERVTAIACSPDGQFAASTSYDQTIKLWDLTAGKAIETFRGHTGFVMSVAFSPDGRFLISAAADNTLKLWEISTGREIRTFKGHTAAVFTVKFSPNGEYVLSGSKDQTLKLWEIRSGQEIRTFRGYTDEVTTLGSKLLTGTDKGHLQLWDLPSGRMLRLFSAHPKFITSLAFSPDGRHAVSGALDNTIKLWDISQSGPVKSYIGHTGWINAVAFTPDGKSVFSASKDKTIKLWDTVTGQETRTFRGHQWHVMTIACSPDGRYLLSGSKDRTIKLWDVATGRKVRTLRGHSAAVFSVAFSPDGHYLLSGSADRTIKLWNASTGAELKSFPEENYLFGTVIFSPDGRYILAGLFDNSIKMWAIESGNEIRSFVGHTSNVHSLVFSPDGSYLFTCAEDQTIKMWDTQTAALRLTRVLMNQKDWVEITPDGRFDGTLNGIRFLYFSQANQIIPLDGFFERFYTPNLNAQILASKTISPLAPDIRRGIQVPPLIQILSPKPEEKVTAREIEVVVEAMDQGGGISDIWLFHNDKRVPSTDSQRPLFKGTPNIRRLKYNVTLLSGQNTFRALAFSSDRTASLPVESTVTWYGRDTRPNLHVVAVAIDHYLNPRYQLQYAVSDASVLINQLKISCADIFNRIYIHPVYNAHATRLGLETVLNHVVNQTQPEDVFIFFYAGHGMMSTGDSGQPADFYLIPTEVTQIYDNDSVLVRKAFSAQQLKEICQRIEARKQLLIIDACQSGGAIEAFRWRGILEEKALAQLARSTGVMLLTSTRSEQLAAEFSSLNHGLFTYTLLQGIRGRADGAPRDGRITVCELCSYLQSQMPELSQRFGNAPQYPNAFLWGQDFPICMTETMGANALPADDDSKRLLYEDFSKETNDWREYDLCDRLELDYGPRQRLEFRHWERFAPGYIYQPVTLQDFVLEYTLNITADSGNANYIGPGFSDNLDVINRVKNGIYCLYYAGCGGPQLDICTFENGKEVWFCGGWGERPNRIWIENNRVYYIRLEKHDNLVTLSIFADADRTHHLPGSPKSVLTNLGATTFHYFYAIAGSAGDIIFNWEWTSGWHSGLFSTVFGEKSVGISSLNLLSLDYSSIFATKPVRDCSRINWNSCTPMWI